MIEDQALESRVARLRQVAIDRLSELVRVDTSNPPGRGCRECVDVLTRHCHEAGLETREWALEGAPYEALVMRASTPAKGPTFYLHGHYDVVPASDSKQFEPEVRGDCMFGRGTSDMKGGLVAKVLAAQVLGEVVDAPDGRLVLHVVPGEETGGGWGATWLTRLGLVDPTALGALVGEPTSAALWTAHRGALSARVHVRGRTAHVGMPSVGRNAVLDALPLLEAAREFAERFARHTTDRPVSPAQARNAAAVVGGQIEGPGAPNAVPAWFRFTIDLRTNPSQDVSAVRAELEETLTRAAGDADWNLEVFQESQPSAIDDEHWLARCTAEHVDAVTGSRPRLELCPGVLESRVYSAAGVPALAYGPGILSVSHGPEEYVSIDAVLDAVTVYARVALAAFRRAASARNRASG